MHLKIFTIYDSATGIYQPPLSFRAPGEALRFWKHLVTNADTQVGKNPEDFSLYMIGTYNDNTAEYEGSMKTCIQTGEEALSEARNIQPGSLKEHGLKLNSRQPGQENEISNDA